MATLEKKTIKTTRSLNYTYYVSQQADSSKPALLFIHGFPDSAHMWSDVVDKLSDLPYKVIVPDCLGYAGTDKPTDPSQYKMSGMTADLADIIEAEQVEKVIILGHDWGAGLVSRFYNYFPELCAGVILLNVAYLPPPAEKFDLDAINASTEESLGYPLYTYWYLFTAPEGYKTIDNNIDRFWECLHGAEDHWMRKMFCDKPGMVGYLAGDGQVELKSFAKDPKWKDDFMQRFTKDSFQGPTNWYKAMRSNIQFEDSQAIPKENAVVKVPFFFLGCTGDAVCRHEFIETPRKAGLLPDFEMKVIESGHWCAMEEPGKVADAIRGFVTKRFP